MAKTALYRHFDADGVLLYVGITNHSLRRLEQHCHRSSWFQKIARVDIAWHDTREEAMKAEKEAIITERPAHNIRLTVPTPPAQTTAGLSLGRMVGCRYEFMTFPTWADNDVRCRGEQLDAVVWLNEQWAVTTYGLECRDGTYVIEKHRLHETTHGHGWLNHMVEKSWVNFPAFEEALRCAQLIHTGRISIVTDGVWEHRAWKAYHKREDQESEPWPDSEKAIIFRFPT